VLTDWPHLEEHKVNLYYFCEEALKQLDILRRETREGESKSEVREQESVKIQIKPPQVLLPSKNPRAESSVGERPKKRHHGENVVSYSV